MPYINTKYSGNCAANNCIKSTREIKVGERIFYLDKTKKSMHEACASLQFADSTNPMRASSGEANTPSHKKELMNLKGGASEANPTPPMPKAISEQEIDDCMDKAIQFLLNKFEINEVSPENVLLARVFDVFVMQKSQQFKIAMSKRIEHSKDANMLRIEKNKRGI
jgi:hypothetical protein